MRNWLDIFERCRSIRTSPRTSRHRQSFERASHFRRGSRTPRAADWRHSYLRWSSRHGNAPSSHGVARRWIPLPRTGVEAIGRLRDSRSACGARSCRRSPDTPANRAMHIDQADAGVPRFSRISPKSSSPHAKQIESLSVKLRGNSESPRVHLTRNATATRSARICATAAACPRSPPGGIPNCASRSAAPL
jgi:hypothetical protein